MSDVIAAALVDALGRRVALRPLPRRIVSLVPSVTQCLFDLGAGNRVVGRTDYCTEPAEAARLPSVGGPKTVRPDAVARLRPDLVVADVEENDREQVEELTGRGIRVFAAFPRSLEDAARFLEDTATLLGLPAAGREHAGRLRRVPPPPRGNVRAACLVWRDPWMTATAQTLPGALLAAAGAENVFAEGPGRYPVVGAEELAAARPRAVLLPSEPYPFGEGHRVEIESLVPGAAALLVPGEWLTWYGCRMPEAIEGLRGVLAPLRDPVGPHLA